MRWPAPAVAVLVAGLAACTSGAGGAGLSDDPEAYVPKEVDGRALAPPGEIARNFVDGFPGAAGTAAGEVPAAEKNPKVPYPGAFVVALRSPTAAEQVRRTLDRRAPAGRARIRHKEIEGVQVDYYDVAQGGVSAAVEFLVGDHDLLVVVMSFEGRPLADHLMAAAIRGARTKKAA